MKEYSSVDEYIADQPEFAQPKLIEMRKAIRERAPQAEEKFSYGMPTYKTSENLVHFAAQKNHIGFYPTPDSVEKFADKLPDFKHSKGAFQFPYSKPLPMDVIKEIVAYRVEQRASSAFKSEANLKQVTLEEQAENRS